MKKLLSIMFGFMVIGVSLLTISCAIGEEEEDKVESVEVWELNSDTWYCDAESASDGDCENSDIGSYVTDTYPWVYTEDIDDDGSDESVTIKMYISLQNNKARYYYGYSNITNPGTDTTSIGEYGFKSGIYYCGDEDETYTTVGTTYIFTDIDSDSYAAIIAINGSSMAYTDYYDSNTTASFTKTTISPTGEFCDSDTKKRSVSTRLLKSIKAKMKK